MRAWWAAAAAMLAATAVPTAAQDWTRTIARTATGSHVKGNPKAAVKLVEYISMTCPHCAHFVAESAPHLDRRVRAGTTSVELRHAVRDPLDMAATLLARCGGGRRVFDNAGAILAAQDGWIAKAVAWQDANRPAIGAMSTNQKLKGYAAQSGLVALMRARGYKAAQLDACLSDTAEQTRLSEQAGQAFQIIRGTPGFLINGQLVAGVSNWSRLESALAAAGSK